MHSISTTKSLQLLYIFLLISNFALAQNDKSYIPDPKLFSEDIGGNAFIKGQYLELGVSGKGCLITTSSPPSGYHLYGTSYLGMVSDNAKNGWTVGTPPQSGDYFVPGLPFEGFKVEFNGTVYENNGNVSTIGIPGAIVPTSDSPTLKKAIWQGETSGKFSIKQTVTIGNNNTYATFRIVLRNISSSTANIYYSRTVDPDQESTITGEPSTNNTIVSQYPSNNRSLVKAVGLTHGIYFGMVSNDPRSKVCFTGSTWSLNPSQYYGGTAGAILSGNATGDYATALTFNLGNVAASDSVVFEYAFLTNQTDEDAFSCLPTATLSGNQSIIAGQTANLTLNLTGTPPWNFVMNGQTFFDVSTSPLTIPVTPASTTTYALSSLSNTCGAGSFSGSATVSVCNPSEAPSGTISGSQTIFAGQTANLSLTFAGSPPWTAVVNGFTISNINLSPFTLSVSPSATTTYTLSSVSNSCGANTTASSATVSVCSGSTATLSGTQFILAGQTANLSVALTGIAPWTVVMNGQTYNNITSSPFTIPVSPVATTTYSLTSVSNVCGSGTVSGSATVTICVAPTATLTGNQTINEGQSANLSVALTGTSPWSFTINGTNYNNITTNPYVLTVSPTVTNTYTLTSVTNPCGISIATSSATINVAINLNNGLVSCYAFTTNAIDGKGKNNAVNNGATLTTDRLDRQSNAYDFDGNDYINAPSNGITSNNNYTYSAWVRPNSLPTFGNAQTILSVGDSQAIMLANNANTSGPSWYFWGYEQGGAIRYTSTPVSEANRWYHIIAVRSNTTYKIYIDGVFKVQTTAVDLPLYSTNTNYIGNSSLPNYNYWTGKIDDIRMYNYAMSDAQVTALNGMSLNDNCDALIHNESGLVSCYAFSGDAKDEFTNNHGTASNVTLTSDRFSNSSSAYTFSGDVSNYVQIANANSFVNTNYSYAVWVKVNSLPSIGVPQWIFGVGQHGVGDQALYVYNDGGTISFTSHSYANPSGCVTGLRSANGGVMIEANRWYHVVITMSGSLYAMYIDGKLITSSPSTCTSLIFGSPSAYIGNRLGTLSPFYGVIDDIRMYNRAISLDEIKSLRYTNGCRTKCPETLSISNTYSPPLQPLRNEANQIVGTNIINSNTEIRYDASKSILLQPGFKVEQGAIFEAYTNGCGGGK